MRGSDWEPEADEVLKVTPKHIPGYCSPPEKNYVHDRDMSDPAQRAEAMSQNLEAEKLSEHWPHD